VIIPAPYWVSYPSMVMLAGGNPVIIDTTEKDRFKIKPEILEKAITDKTKAIVINSPSNPTGTAYTNIELEKIAKVLQDRDLYIISDDIYESIVYNGFKFSNIANISEEMKQKTLVLNGVSKSYSMTGWRIGYMAGNSKIIKKIETLQSQSTSNPASISQWAALEALTGDQSIISKMVSAFEKRKKIIVQGLNDIPGFNCMDPAGSFYVFPDIKGVFALKGWNNIADKIDSEFNSSKLSTYLLNEAKVAVVPGIAFGNDNHLRLSFATSEENIVEGLKRIRQAIEKIISS